MKWQFENLQCLNEVPRNKHCTNLQSLNSKFSINVFEKLMFLNVLRFTRQVRG
jgi:hypothetical protein